MNKPTERLADLGGVVADFAVTGQHICCILGRELLKLDKDTGGIVLRRTVFEKDGLSRKLIAQGGQLFVYDFCTLHIFRQDDLEPLWSRRLGEDLTSDVCGMAADESAVYCSIRNGKLTAVDRKNREIREAQVSNSSMWSVIVYGSDLLCGTVDGRLLLIDKDSLTVKRELALGKKNIASLLVHGDALYAAGQDGRLFKISPEDFAVLAQRRNVHKKMFRLAGLYGDAVVTVSHPCSEIAFWHRDSMERIRLLSVPLELSGRAVIDGDRLYVSSRNIPGIDVLRLGLTS